MGMAASQVRLLSLTSRMHDIEFRAQSIEAQKIALATREDEIYEDYCAAMDATKIQVAYRGASAGIQYVDANFASVCTYQESRCQQQYALRNNDTNRIIVTSEVKAAYDKNPNDKYAFAYAAIGLELPESPEIGIGSSNSSYVDIWENNWAQGDCYMTNIEREAFEDYINNVAEGGKESALYKQYEQLLENENASERRTLLREFRENLYLKVGNDIFDRLKETDDNKEFSKVDFGDIGGEFNYYVKLWEAITEAGGCEEMDAAYISGEEGNEWFNDRINSGRATLMEFSNRSTKKGWVDTSVTATVNPNYLIESTDTDKVKKAEMKYEHDLKVIDRKDKKFDLELSKLETERTAIKTEMDSIKKVRDDNIETNFGIFG